MSIDAALLKRAADGDAEALAEVNKLSDRAEYLEAELQKAISARDKAKQGGRMSAEEREELETLRGKAAEAEEAQQRKAGEFDALKAKLEKRVTDAEAKATETERRFADKVIETAFYGATDLFGGANARTTLLPDFALARFREFVKFVPGENGHGGSVVVHNQKGEAITSTDGEPAPFAEAMGRLIEEWPAKDAILRAGGRPGSGSTGGGATTDTTIVTRAELAQRAAKGDKDALTALKAQPVPGQVQSGPGFDRLHQPPQR